MSVRTEETKRSKRQPQKKTKKMGTHITIFEAIIVSGLSLFVYVLILSVIDHFKSKSK